MVRERIAPALLKFIQNPVRLFLILAVPIGLFCVFAVPPLAGNDEISHVARVYELANGNFITDKMKSADNFGGNIPTELVDLYTSNRPLDPLHVDHAKISAAKAAANKARITSISHMVETSYSGSALYSPLSYLPQVAAMLAAKVCGLSILYTVYLIRLTDLVVFLVLTSTAILIIPTKKWFLLAISALPMPLLLASSISLDGIVIGAAMLFCALIVRAYQQKQPCIQVGTHALNIFWLISPIALYLALAKPVYAPFILLSLLAVDACFVRWSTQWIRWAVLTVAVPLALMFVWNGIITAMDVSAGQRASVNSVGIYPATTSQFMQELTSNPVHFVKVGFHTFFDNSSDNQNIPNYILTSWSGKFTEYRIAPAVWTTVVAVITVVLAFFMRERRELTFSERTRLYTIMAFVIAICGIALSMYLYATGAGQDTINGIQGRYFIPLTPFLLFLAAKKPLLAYESSAGAKSLLLSMLVLNNVVMIYLLAQAFLA